MEALADPASLQFFLLFAAPGFVALYVRSQFLTGRMPPIAEGISAYVTLSLIYHAALFPILPSLYLEPVVGWRWGAWFGILFIFPALLGASLGLNVRKGWTKWLLTKAKINTVHPVNVAWDWRFGECKECWVLVVLKNETKWAGFLGERSFMSSDPSERDIFIEKVYEIDGKTDVWTARDSSVWIAHGEIQTIEFWPAS